ncbi:ATP-binding protein [Caulobacter zeae]|uniref:ATP-binding protein n=2 Tax=Caulobacter zeae TaxID=2055137 RepID=A0A2N5DQJ1_9CAUL|nr:ATP-binding protein [Caulobacter zeae]
MEAGAEEAIGFAREYAALSGPFAPGDALRAAGAFGADQPLDLAVSVSAALAAACDTGVGKAGAWLLRASERAWDLKRLSDQGLLEVAKLWRRKQGMDPATNDLLDALDGRGDFSSAAVAAALEATEAGRDGALPDLPRLAAALEWSGGFAPAASLLARVQAALSRADQKRRGDLLLEDGFHGREDLSQALVDWIRAPEDRQGRVRALYVSGLPAIGKSTLLEHALRQVAGLGVNVVVARLDFDRASLDVLDRLGLSLELARQVASQAPEIAAELRAARLEAVSTREARVKGGRGRGFLPYALIEALSDYLRDSKRRLVIVLDTLEVLRGRGETHPGQLFEWLDQLRRAGLGPLVVVAAGRGDALEPVQDRVAVPLALDSLTETDAAALLAQSQTPPQLWGAIIQRADGDPMRLRLLGAVARREGAAGLERDEGATVTLYRSLESRLGGRHGKIARFVPLFRRFDSRLLGEVIAPVVVRRRLSAVDAADLWAGLKEQTWLIGGQSAAGWLEPHRDIRRRLAGKLYEEGSDLAHKLHRRAARWFSRQAAPWAAAESLYHRLQATRWEEDDALKGMNLEAGIAFEQNDLDDLPAPARDAVLRARGERSYEGRGYAAAAAGPVSAEAAGELRMLIGRGDLTEAISFYENVFRPASIDPVGEAAEAALVLLWRTGRWREARRLADERAWSRPWDEALFDAWPEAALVRLEMRAEFKFADLRRWFGEAGNEDRRDRTTRLIMASKANLAAGALGFAAAPQRLLPERTDTVAAVQALWSLDAPREDLQSALLIAEERRRRIDPAPAAEARSFFSQARDAQAMAILSPYDDLGEWLLRDRRDGRLHDMLNARVAAFPEFAALRHDPAAPAATLSALGLTAEWLSAAGFLLGDQDLRSIGRSAERWRSTAAGWWRYGRPPRNWQGVETGLDVVTEDRLEDLSGGASPGEAARAQLAAWAGGEVGMARILRAAKLDRLREDLAQASPKEPREQAQRAASKLSRRWIPAAFVPALAILAIEPQGTDRS